MAQVRSLCRAWEWSAADSILHPLPLHHIHGIVNALYCPLYAGAHVELMPKFSPAAVWGGITKVCAVSHTHTSDTHLSHIQDRGCLPPCNHSLVCLLS